MAKQYIRLNDNDEHLSLGNLFRIIKEMATNRSSALQGELFCTLFEVDSVNDTTVNNYCVGCRSIGTDYKQIYINKQKRYINNKAEFIDVILSIINILDGVVHTVSFNTEAFINNNESAINLARKLYNLAKNDNQVQDSLRERLFRLLEERKIYECLVEELFFIVLVKKQPIYEEELKREVFENVLNDTSISSVSLQEYLSLKLREGINFDYSMKKLAAAGNAYANYELGSDEYYGHVTGEPRYDRALKYLNVAAEMNHASANYLIGNIYVRGLVGNRSKQELEKGYEYLVRSYDLGNIAASNLIGNMYHQGIYPLEKNVEKAIEYYKKASEANFVFSINNLGRIEEEKNNYEKAYEIYLKSADLGESWACNKMGEYYRKKGEFKKAYSYYIKALDCNHRVLNYYAYYNLAKYYYMNGCEDIGKDVSLAIKYYEIASEHNIIEASVDLFLYYANEYKKNKTDESYKKLGEMKRKIETNDKYNEVVKRMIEEELVKIRNKQDIDARFIEDLIR